MKAELFAKGLEKCRLLNRLIGQNLEKLDDYGGPKFQDLIKTDSLWICSSYPFQHKTRLQCAERKAKVHGERATCSRSLIVFLSQLFVIFLTIFGCFWRIHLSKDCHESTVWVGIWCSVAGYILPSPRL